MRRFSLFYYSGTGSTAMAAEHFANALQNSGCTVNVQVISDCIEPEPARYDMLLLLFPVYAFNAPASVYRFIDRMEKVSQTPAAVISVSGGGEVSPNTACRIGAIRRLERKGYTVVYEHMLTMPSNFLTPTKEPLAEMLVQILPPKVSGMAAEMLSGIRRRTTPSLIDRFFSACGQLEKYFTKFFGKHIQVSSACSGCGLCSRRCPAGNITMASGKPVFASKCHLCLKCLYGCPQKALTPGVGKFIILKNGYPLSEWAKRPCSLEMVDLDTLAAGYAWSGVKKYLQNEKG